MDTPAPFCLTCRYSLTGLAKGKCPECGREFDPADATTVGPRAAPILLKLVRIPNPPWWVVGVFSIGASLFVLGHCAPKGRCCDISRYWLFDAGVAILIVSIPIFLCHLAGWLMIISRGLKHGLAWKWLLFPAVYFVLVYLASTGIVFDVRVHLAQGALHRAAVRSAPAKAGDWIGTFHVLQVNTFNDGTIQCELGYPDAYSDGGVTLEFGPTAPRGSQWDIELGEGWWLTWDST